MEQAGLAIGQLLGHYRIEEKLGEGGMGVVYRAVDTRLERIVAIKLLRANALRDPDRRRRFVLEAKAASALNHPNIIIIHAIEQSDGIDYIVMEFVTGRTLGQVIASGLTVDQSLNYALQIASALARAHSAGIIHRDIKPENIIVTSDQVKILDFGLAKLAREADELTGLAASAGQLPQFTTAPGLTIPGATMGTLAYMSPEQVRGEKLDARSDIFAFGAVLYEMVTSRRAFSHESLTAVIDETPEPPARLNPSIPARLDRIIGKALEKELERRYQSAEEMLADLQELKTGAERWRVARPALMISVGLVVLAIAISVGVLRRRAAQARPVRATFSQVTDLPGRELFPSLSSDGKLLAYMSRVSGKWDIYVQPLAGGSPANLTADDPAGGSEPAFSPDSRRIAFRSTRDGGGIYVMAPDGTAVRRVVAEGFNPAWSSDGREIIYDTEDVLYPESRYGVSQLWAVDVASGRKRLITKGDAVQPNSSPHGYRIAYWGREGGMPDLWTVAADGSAPVRITNDKFYDWNPVWSPDGKYLYFSSSRGGSMNLWRVAVDEKTGAALGAPEPITTPATFSGHLSISADGKTLAYSQQTRGSEVRKVAFDPASGKAIGAAVPVIRGTSGAGSPDVSPDGTFLTFVSPDTEHVFVSRTDGTGSRQITNGEYKDRFPRWSPDGKRIVFYRSSNGRAQVWAVNVDGSRLQQLTNFASGAVAPNWSPDGTRLAYSSNRAQRAFLYDLSKPWSEQAAAPLPALGPPDTWFEAWSWSHDGHRIAGHREDKAGVLSGVIVYDLRSGKYTRLTEQGRSPVWLKDDRRILYYQEDKLFLVDSESRKTEQVLSVAPYHITWAISVAPDNQTIYFSLVMEEADIWLAKLDQ